LSVKVARSFGALYICAVLKCNFSFFFVQTKAYFQKKKRTNLGLPFTSSKSLKRSSKGFPKASPRTRARINRLFILKQQGRVVELSADETRMKRFEIWLPFYSKSANDKSSFYH